MSSVDVTTTIVITRPRDLVASYSADPGNVPAWYMNIKAVEWPRGSRPQVGARATFSAQFLGRHLNYTYEIVDFVPGERLVMRTAEGPFPMETTYVWRDGPSTGSTTMTLRNRGDPKGFFRLMAPVMARAVRHANRQDLERLKQLLEAKPNLPSASA